jgi:uncharacterized protein YqfB (UPF0267 family)
MMNYKEGDKIKVISFNKINKLAREITPNTICVYSDGNISIIGLSKYYLEDLSNKKYLTVRAEENSDFYFLGKKIKRIYLLEKSVYLLDYMITPYSYQLEFYF